MGSSTGLLLVEDDSGVREILQAIRRREGFIVLAGEIGTGKTTVCRALLEQLDPEHGYLAVMAYLDRWEHADLEQVRAPLARRTERPVTFGWGPRFLHSTGQFHKGGPGNGVFLQILEQTDVDLEIPGRPFTFGQLIEAQAAGDANVLAQAHGRPVVTITLTDPQAEVLSLFEAAQ